MVGKSLVARLTRPKTIGPEKSLTLRMVGARKFPTNLYAVRAIEQLSWLQEGRAQIRFRICGWILNFEISLETCSADGRRRKATSTHASKNVTKHPCSGASLSQDPLGELKAIEDFGNFPTATVLAEDERSRTSHHVNTWMQNEYRTNSCGKMCVKHLGVELDVVDLIDEQVIATATAESSNRTILEP